MTQFSAAKVSTATVPWPRTPVWDVLADAGQVARLTPMVRSIQDQGQTWLWKLAPIEVMGHSIGLSFTERMEFTPRERIQFTHEPSATERAGVGGTYALDDNGRGTRLTIDLSVHVELPFPRLARPAVHASMQAVLAAMGAGFAHNLDKHLRSVKA